MLLRVYICIPIPISIYLSIYLSIHLSIYLSICLSVYLSIYLHVAPAFYVHVAYMHPYVHAHIRVIAGLTPTCELGRVPLRAA